MSPCATTPRDKVDIRKAINRRLIPFNLLSSRSGITRRSKSGISVHLRIVAEIDVDLFIILHRGEVHHVHDNLVDVVIDLSQRRRLD